MQFYVPLLDCIFAFVLINGTMSMTCCNYKILLLIWHTTMKRPILRHNNPGNLFFEVCIESEQFKKI